MRPYPTELRKPIVAACRAGDETQEQIARRFGVSYGFVKKLWRQWCETGTLEPGKMGGHRKPVVRGAVLTRLKNALKRNPDATLAELRNACGAECSLVTIHNTLKREGYRRKKNAARR